MYNDGRSAVLAEGLEALRSLILDDLARGAILPGFGVVLALGAVMLALNVRMIERYD